MTARLGPDTGGLGSGRRGVARGREPEPPPEGVPTGASVPRRWGPGHEIGRAPGADEPGGAADVEPPCPDPLKPSASPREKR